ncbi:MAG: hypothetical protein ACREEZ_01365 [Stellaceae bacterium]
MAVFDTLKLARSLRQAGMPGEQAEATAEALAEAFTREIAEKRDIEALRRDIEAASALTTRDLEAASASTKRDLEAASASTKRDLEAVAATAKRDLDSAVDELNARLTFLQWQLGLITALVLAALLKLFLR